MKLNFQQKLILSFLAIFTVFTTGIVVFEQQRARRYKTEALQERLSAYADEVSRYLLLNDATPDSLLLLMPQNLRLTLVARSGKVTYDNMLPDLASVENHGGRPEIARALAKGSGSSVRTSASNSQPYLYYAKDAGNGIIVRVAMPYDINVRLFLKPDNAFLYFVVALFMAGFILIYCVSRRLGRSVRQLRDFSVSLNNGKEKAPLQNFPDDEFGEIGQQLVRDFNIITESKKQLAQEREKLLLHIHTSAEGICFFSSCRKVAFCNGLFLQYFNALSGVEVAPGREILDGADFNQVAGFLNDTGGDSYYETRIGRRGKEFLLRLNIFEDRSFEIILTDITAKEKNRRLKQEMTGNIAHELRTPVTSVRGYLETILNQPLDAATQRRFISKAYGQTLSLSELISDMGMLTRIEDAPDSFRMENVDILSVVEQAFEDMETAIKENSMSVNVDIPRNTVVNGNENLLYSIFRNLTDNAVKYAGKGASVYVGCCNAGDGYYCFSFSDNGAGIADERHLSRIFERFYRISEGRTRDSGGSGLGLSIVRNAIAFHKGTVSVKKRTGGGLEFSFRLPAKK
ncbi:MAG: HAMP domain-containing histidine kinase [Bacteroidales bacterium]|jgi:signal transduction histidine kinase|nr:HAMP domain-containing histidine kinase [Bacteroidales bacterium]